jgi:hypothetical protein
MPRPDFHERSRGRRDPRKILTNAPEGSMLSCGSMTARARALAAALVVALNVGAFVDHACLLSCRPPVPAPARVATANACHHSDASTSRLRIGSTPRPCGHDHDAAPAVAIAPIVTQVLVSNSLHATIPLAIGFVAASGVQFLGSSPPDSSPAHSISAPHARPLRL